MGYDTYDTPNHEFSADQRVDGASFFQNVGHLGEYRASIGPGTLFDIFQAFLLTPSGFWRNGALFLPSGNLT